MKNDKVQALLDDLGKKDPELDGSVVFHIGSGAVVASTLSEDYNQKTVKIEQLVMELEKDRILKLDPTGPKNWMMSSWAKKIVVTARIKGDVFVSCEYAIEKAPSAAIEDVLEIALMVNQHLG
jgi:hypothetical protein